ncbi:LLM class flavin-dependent oxidoreductase [Falsirhodobacter halotolerans]|uniref:LLM class flavin-dependent oxidoreductase n=1 Tax=Falsirhodobacter halotolerans TaxID=1146892 RepID=UPI001FD01977|nr:LLM class flavin-dependent oxidoreductase [Falsirhodobacter halotolerans]MCJ8140621.1 LLM class flavin-dependent oxidoreductase [Falsirhodobacter halotolerans]
MTLELGLDTFGDMTNGPDGAPLSHAQVIRNVVDQGVLADQVGVDFIGIGEHHREDFAISAPEVVLAGIAARTERIRLGSAVTVLSSDDPIRVFQRFATVDAISGGRAEVILGRGSFTESFPLFGHDLSDYERLFTEKLDLFARLAREKKVTWKGTIHPGLKAQEVFPPMENGPLKTWIGVGGSPESVVRAAHYSLPLMLAIIGGSPARFRPYVDLYLQSFEAEGKVAPPIGVHSPGHVAATDAEARDQFFAGYSISHALIGRTRGWPPLRRADFDREVDRGSMYVGSPETVAGKIAATVRALSLSRFDLKYSGGPVPHDVSMEGIRLYGEKVIPMVRDMLA